MHPIVVNEVVTVPAEALSMTATHSSGPGGNNVTDVHTKVRLFVELDRIVGLHEDERVRLREIARHRIDAQGRLQVISQKTSDQLQNLDDARRKVRALVLSATVHRAERLGTTTTVPAVQKRIDEKKSVGRLKAERHEDFSDEIGEALE